MATGAAARGTLFALRGEIARIEGRLAERFDAPERVAANDGTHSGAHPVQIGVERFDMALGGGLPSSGLLEIQGSATRDAGAAVGFTLALSRLLATGKRDAPLLWIGTSEIFREAGRPYAPGLAARFGLSAEHLLIAEAERLSDVLWIAEEAARLDALQAVLLEIRGSPHKLDLTATRRLHRRALIAGLSLLLIREAGEAEPTAAPVRLIVAAAPAAPRLTMAGPLAGSIGPPAFHVTISKSRTSIPATVTLEWNDVAFRERRERPATNYIPVVPVSPRGPTVQTAVRKSLAFRERNDGTAADLQPIGEQHPAHRRPRRAG